MLAQEVDFLIFNPAREITHHRSVTCGEGLLTYIILASNLSAFYASFACS